MFGKEKSRNDVAVMAPPARNGSTPPPLPAVESGPVESVFAAALTIKGDINFEGAIRVEGEIHGRITGQGRLTVSPTGRVIGDVMSAEVIIHGMVQGNVTSLDRLEIGGSAQVVGDLKAARLSIGEGCKILGRLDINSESMSAMDSAAPARKAPEPEPEPDALDKVL
ncbi:MAG: polymer-forming cytoskeletal protein [Planctomycetota bacterium]|nr:MAG: polymer-forming cytoskeletal protein [Planctomycetota bacterium]